MDKFQHNLPSLIYPVGKLGRLLPISAVPTIAGDTMRVNLRGALRLSPLRHFLVTDAHVHIAAYHVKHRHMYDNWEDFLKAGIKGGVTLDTLTSNQTNQHALMPNTPNNGTIPAHYWRGYNSIWNEYYRVANNTDPIDRDYKENADIDYRDYGRFCARLPDFWNTGLEDSMYDAQDYAEVGASAGAGAINLLDLAEVKGEYQSEISREWYDTRYRDLIKSGWGSNGVSTDADQRPEILMVEEHFLSGRDIDSTDYASSGQSVGKSQGVVELNIPPKYFNEHGMLWIVMLIRFPSIIESEVHYLSNRTLTYENLCGDPRVMENQPPLELLKSDFIDAPTQGTDSWGHHPYGQWYRTHPNFISRKLVQKKGYPFVQENLITTADERIYDQVWKAEEDYFTDNAILGGSHYNMAANLDIQSKRIVPPASKSIYAGAH